MVFNDWARGLSEEEARLISKYGHEETVEPWPLDARKRFAFTLCWTEQAEELEAAGRRKEANALRECREHKCFLVCERYLGEKCCHLGGKKVPRVRNTFGGCSV